MANRAGIKNTNVSFTTRQKVWTADKTNSITTVCRTFNSEPTSPRSSISPWASCILTLKNNSVFYEWPYPST